MRDQYFAGGLTYSGHVLACASAVASIEAFREEGIVENSAAMGEYSWPVSCRGLAERRPSIGDVRGKGLFWGLKPVKDRGTREPLVPFNASGADAAPVVAPRPRPPWSVASTSSCTGTSRLIAPPLTITR